MRTLQGCDPAFSLRAMVPLTKIDAVRAEVRDTGHVITVDTVILPSHDDAYIIPMGSLESTFAAPNTGNGFRDITITVTESDSWLSYLQDESFNLKTVIEHYNVNVDSITYNKDNDTIVVKENTGVPGIKRTAIVKADDYIRNEVSSMFARLGGR
jgi:hypothetical protein